MSTLYTNIFAIQSVLIIWFSKDFIFIQRSDCELNSEKAFANHIQVKALLIFRSSKSILLMLTESSYIVLPTLSSTQKV